MNGIKVTEDNFADLLFESVAQARDHAKGLITLKSEPRCVCQDSQCFMRAWEQGDNTPKGTTTRLLQIIEKDPAYFLETITEDKSA